MAYAHEIAEQTARENIEDGETFFALGRPVEDVDQGHDVACNVRGYATQRQSIACTVYRSMVPSVVRELYLRDARFIESKDPDFAVAIIARRLEDSTAWEVATYRVIEDLAYARWVASRMLDGVLNLTTQRWV